MENKIITMRESIDSYRSRIASEGFFENRQENLEYYPDSNHVVTFKASSDLIKKVFEESGEFKFNQEIKDGKAYLHSFDCLKTDALVLTQCLDKGGVDKGCFCETYNLDPKSWIPMTIHPYLSSRIQNMSADEYFPFIEGLGKNSTYFGAIDTLEIILSVAEKYKIPMITKHIGLRDPTLAIYKPELNQEK